MVRQSLRDVRNAALTRFLEAPGRFAVFGTGAGGEAVAEALAALGLKPEAFVDSYREGRFRGARILGPEEAAAVGFETIVTASMYAREMTAQLRGDGYEGPVLDGTVVCDPRWSGHFDETVYDDARDEISFARSLIQPESRAIFDAVLAHRRSLDPGDLPPPTPPYRHPEVPVLPGERIFDGGAFDGETSLDYAEAVGSEGRVHAFEPASENLERLREAVAQHPHGARVSVEPVGCWNRTGEIRLATDGAPSQFRVTTAEANADGESAPGTEAIRVVALDEFAWEQTAGRVDWIKLDVEGAEREALAGAKALLTERTPKLAICIYHRPSDLWELPILLKETVPGYRLHLGHHSQNLYDTVCYARPPD